MKCSFVALAAMVTAVMAKPTLLNSAFNVEEGKPFEIKYSGCEGGCTIVLQTGESTNLKDVQTLTSSASGDSFTFTPSGLPSDTYNFKITNNASGEFNYSSQWAYKGTGSLPSSTTTSTETKSTTVTSSGAHSGSLTIVTPAATTTTTTTSASKNTPVIISTPGHSNGTSNGTANATTVSAVRKPSQSGEHKSAAAASASITSVPSSGASHLTASFALVAGAVMAMVYLN